MIPITIMKVQLVFDMNELDFQKQLKNYKRIYGDGYFAFEQAAETHSLSCLVELDNTISKLYLLLDVLKSETSKKFLAYGLLRRLMSIKFSYEAIRDNCHIDRKEPLNAEERRDLERDLNMVYINVRGALDNLASIFIHERDSHLYESLELAKHKMRLSLFSKDLRKASSFQFWKIVNDEFGAWATEFAIKRDPVAHGLPMYFVPKFFESEEQREEANSMDDGALSAVLAKDFKTSEDLMARSESLGVYVPLFSSDPSEKLMYIYPTISIDISKLVLISNKLEEALRT